MCLDCLETQAGCFAETYELVGSVDEHAKLIADSLADAALMPAESHLHAELQNKRWPSLSELVWFQRAMREMLQYDDLKCQSAKKKKRSGSTRGLLSLKLYVFAGICCCCGVPKTQRC